MLEKRARDEIRYHGVGVSPGIALAQVHVIGGGFEEPATRAIAESKIPKEEERLKEALAVTRAQIVEMQAAIAESVGSKNASIFDAHLLVLEDQPVLEEIVRELRQRRENVESVFYRVMRRYLESLRKIPDPYLRERGIDVEDVTRRVIRNLERVSPKDAGSSKAGVRHIIVSHDLTPSHTATMNREEVMGFATEVGSHTSHTAIIARSLGIPAVVGLHDICDALHTGQEILLDGYNGMVILNASEETLASYKRLEAENDALDEKLLELKDTKSATKDGRAIILSGNIEFVHEAHAIRESGAEGVGLYRTEFFFVRNDRLPTEEEQAMTYAEVAAAVQPHAVIFRTLDVGGDKINPQYKDESEPNPFLGWRGIRVSLKEKEVFRSQLRAILRASKFGRVGIMYPLVSGLAEVREANAILEECKEQLRDEGVGFDEQIEVGAMMEVPSAAIMAELIAPEVDFFSIGTNDLIQYTIAVDRVNEQVADLYQPSHPAVIRLMKLIVDAARTHGIWSGICGEMAGDLVFTPLMVGLGFDELSVAPPQLPRVKRALQSLETGPCKTLVGEVLLMSDPVEIFERCREVAAAHYPELLR